MSIRLIASVLPVEPATVVRRRRRVVAGVSLLGTGLLGVSFATQPDSKKFYGFTAAVAATWTLGGVLSGPLHLGWIQSRDQRLRRPIITPVATGVAAFGCFYGCALVARHIPVLDRAIGNVLVFADEGRTPMVVATTLANGLGEEIFFRGFLFGGLRRRLPFAIAAVISAAIFGAFHYTGPGSLAVLPQLAMLGLTQAWLYERSGSIYSTMAVHIINNALAFTLLTQ